MNSIKKYILIIILLLVSNISFSQISESTDCPEKKHTQLRKYKTKGDFCLASKNGHKLGVYDNKKKQFIIPCQYSRLTLFQTKDSILIATKKNILTKKTETFLIDKSSNVLSEKYEYIKKPINEIFIASFKENYKNFYVFINTKGKVISEKYKDLIFNKDLNIYIVQNLDNTYGALDINRNLIIPFEYQRLSVTKNYIVAKRKNKYGIINNKGKTIIPFEYNHFNGFYDDKIIAVKNGKTNIIDTNNKIIRKTDYYSIETPDINGNLVIRDEKFKYGLVNSEFEILIPIENSRISHQDNLDYYYVRKNKLVGLYDVKGNLLIPIEYQFFDIINPYSDRLLVKKDDKYGVIDLKNRILIPLKYEKIKPFKNKKIKSIFSNTKNEKLRKQFEPFLKGYSYIVLEKETTFLINENNNKIIINNN